MQKRTLFGYIADKGIISPEDAAKAADVSIRRAEKWKYTEGISPMTEEECRKLSEFVFEKSGKKELDEIFEKISPRSDQLTHADRMEMLCKALPMEWNEEKKDKPDVPIRIYLPQCNERIPSAIKAFWQTVRDTEVPCDIYIADWGIYALDDMEHGVFQYCAEEMLCAVKRGFSIQIITPERTEYPEGRDLLRRLPLYLNEKITFYRLPSAVNLPANESWFTLGMKSVLLIRVLPSEAPVTTLIQEPNLAQFYYSWMQLLIAETRPINHHISDMDTVNIFTRMKSDVHPMMTVFFLESAPSCLHMPPQLQREIMRANNAEETEITECQRISMLRASIRSICKCTQIYNGDRILELLHEEKYKDPILSGMLGRPAYITSDQLKRQLRFFLSETEHTNYTMYLPSFETDLRLSQCGISLAVQEDSMTAVMDLINRNRNFYSTDLSCTGGFAVYMEQICRMIPPVKRSGSWTRRLLKRYIEL